MDGGCLGYLGASTEASQPLDRILLWVALIPELTLNESVEGKKEGGWGGGMRTTVARNLIKLPAPKNQLLKETPNTLRLRNKQHDLLEDNRYLEHKCKHAETKLEQAMWACTWKCDCWPRKTPAKLVAVNFVKYHLTKLKLQNACSRCYIKIYNVNRVNPE